MATNAGATEVSSTRIPEREENKRDPIRTAGGPRPQRPRDDEGAGDFPGVSARAARCDRRPVAVRCFYPADSRAMSGSWVAPFVFSARIGTMNLDRLVAADVSRLKLPQ